MTILGCSLDVTSFQQGTDNCLDVTLFQQTIQMSLFECSPIVHIAPTDNVIVCLDHPGSPQLNKEDHSVCLDHLGSPHSTKKVTVCLHHLNSRKNVTSWMFSL